MKKIHIAITVLATVALTSCVQEKSFNNHVVGENEVAFVLQASPSTRSAESVSPVSQGVTIPLGTVEHTNIYLEETITDLSFVGAETRSTPAFTENVGKLYKDDLFVTATEFGDATFETMDDKMVGGGWRYHHNYSSDKWPGTDAVNFFLRMPANMAGTDGTGASNIVNTTDLKTTFSYVSPATAADQKDLIFAQTTLNKSQHQGYLPDGAPVTFYHALTAVKFAIANYDETNKITIKSITFSGLAGQGSCVVNPSASTMAGKVQWTLLPAEDPDRTGEYTSGAFGAPVDFNTKANSGGSFVDNGDYPDSFAAAGNKANLNDANASQTFWFIPQEITADVILTIEYTFGSDEVREGVLELGRVLNNNGVVWSAGELRTYTIKVDEVNVRIDDTVEFAAGANEDNGYSGSVKKGVVITNTGNTKAFIRAAIVGQWLDHENNPVFGFTDKVNNLYEVESWYEDQFVNGTHNHGAFTGLVGYDLANPSNNWQLCADGYYYYKVAVNPGEATGSPLFTQYVVGTLPDAEIAGQEIENATMHFELEIATQAISAVKVDGKEGSLFAWDEAWEYATGVRPVIMSQQ